MMINKENYEAFLLDYLEGNLNEVATGLLMRFLDQHPELKADLELTDMPSVQPQAADVFTSKSQLKKQAADAYGLPAMDYLLIKQQEEGLTDEESESLIAGYNSSELLKKDAEKYASATLKYDHTLIYPDKNRLKRSLIIPLFKKHVLYRAASVAIIIILGASAWLLQDLTTSTSHLAQVNKQTETEQTLVSQIDPSPKIVEKNRQQAPISKDSLLKIANDPMQTNKSIKPKKSKKSNQANEQRSIKDLEMIAGAALPSFKSEPVNAYEEGLNAMMPQYMNNNILKQELLAIYRKIEQEHENPSLNIALVENGVKLVNWLSKDRLALEKQYDENENVVGYHVSGNKFEIARKAK